MYRMPHMMTQACDKCLRPVLTLTSFELDIHAEKDSRSPGACAHQSTACILPTAANVHCHGGLETSCLAFYEKAFR